MNDKEKGSLTGNRRDGTEKKKRYRKGGGAVPVEADEIRPKMGGDHRKELALKHQKGSASS